MTLHQGITLAIPSKGINASLLRVIDEALQTNVDEILIAVNPPFCSEDHELLRKFHQSRVKFHIHQDDLGLYGNFRWLVQNARFDLFKFLCTDDSLTSDLDEATTHARSAGKPLSVLNFSYQEYSPDGLKFFGARSPGRLPDLNRPLAEILISPEPSWIFGIWKTAWLKQNFPSHNFDWLDCILLARLISDGLAVIDFSEPITIGTWKWANKIPAPAGGRHKPFFAILHYLLLSPKFIMNDSGSLIKILQHLRNLRSGANRLNVRLKARL